MDSAQLFFKHVQEAEDLVMVSIHDGKFTVFSTFNTEAEAIDIMTKAQEQLLMRIADNRRKQLEEAAAEQTKRIIDAIDKKFH